MFLSYKPSCLPVGWSVGPCLWGGKLKFHLLFFPFAEFSPIFILVSELPDVIRTEPLPLIFNKNNPTREGTEAGVSVCAFVCQCV